VPGLTELIIVFWYVTIIGAIATVVHLATRAHLKAWVVVLIAIALVVVPVLGVAGYWLGWAITRPGRRKMASPA
jgi:hypothetical protein